MHSRTYFSDRGPAGAALPAASYRISVRVSIEEQPWKGLPKGFGGYVTHGAICASMPCERRSAYQTGGLPEGGGKLAGGGGGGWGRPPPPEPPPRKAKIHWLGWDL